MNNKFDLASIIRLNMDDLISAYGLSIIVVSNSEVLLKSDNYTIDVFADRDGVSMVYFDTEARPIKGYNILLYLINKRRDALVSQLQNREPNTYCEFIEININSLVQNIRTAGLDIFDGSKEWLQSYSWPVVLPSGNVVGLIS